MKSLLKIIFNFSLLFFLFHSSFFVSAQAAPEFLVSWRAVNYVPSDYPGKIFPSDKTPIKISFDLIDNGKISDLSKIPVSWFLGSELLQSGNGLKNIVFTSQNADQQIRISISDYRGTTLEKILIIPVARPEAVIDARFPSLEINIGQYRLETKPYFFNISNISDLSFNWFLNGELLTGQAIAPQFLDLNLESAGAPQKTSITISATITNKFDRLESASKILNLTVTQ